MEFHLQMVFNGGLRFFFIFLFCFTLSILTKVHAHARSAILNCEWSNGPRIKIETKWHDDGWAFCTFIQMKDNNHQQLYIFFNQSQFQLQIVRQTDQPITGEGVVLDPDQIQARNKNKKEKLTRSWMA